MKLPPTIAGGTAAHARRAPEPGQGAGTPGETASQFDNILSDVGTKATKPAKAALPADAYPGKPAVGAAVTVAPGNDLPAALDALTTATSLLAARLIDGPTRSAPEDAAKGDDRVLARDDEATSAPTANGLPPQSLLDALLVAAPSAAQQVDASPSPVAERAPASATAAPDLPALLANATPRAAPQGGTSPLVFDISVISQPAPVTSQPAEIALTGLAKALSGAPAKGAASSPKAAASSQTSSRPTVDATKADVGDPGSPVVEISNDDASAHGSASASAGHAARDEGDDAAARDAPPSPVVGTTPASQTSASAIPTLSPPVRQVADTLARLASDTTAQAGASASASQPEIATARALPARTLTLQISPADLGTVAIRMHAVGGSLDVQLTASDPRTAGLLSRERDALAATLQDGRTILHSLVIQDGGGAPQPGGHHATRGDTSGAGVRDQRQGTGAGTSGNGSGSGDQRRQQPASRPRQEDAAIGPRNGVSGGKEQAGGGGRTLLV